MITLHVHYKKTRLPSPFKHTFISHVDYMRQKAQQNKVKNLSGQQSNLRTDIIETISKAVPHRKKPVIWAVVVTL